MVRGAKEREVKLKANNQILKAFKDVGLDGKMFLELWIPSVHCEITQGWCRDRITRV